MKPAVLLLLAASAVFGQDAEKTGVVEGSVVDSVTGAGIEGADVGLSPRQAKRRYDAVTDARGGFRIASVAPGDYVPLARKVGFVSPLSDYFGGGASIHVGAGADAVKLRFELLPPGSLRGRVFGVDGKPAPKVEVSLGPGYGQTATTKEDGSFLIEHVEPGQHSLMARAEGVPTYFPAAVDPALGESIQVAPGVDQGGYEIRLQAATVHRVRGVVLDAAGKPAAKAVIQLFPALQGQGSPDFLLSSGGATLFSIKGQSPGVRPAGEKPVVAGDDGAFELPSVREGDWALRAESVYENRTAPINVRRDIDDLRIRLEAPFELHASVSMSDGSPASGDAPVLLRLISADDSSSCCLGISEKGGMFEIGNLTPGRYRAQAASIGGTYYVTSVMAGAVDALEQPAMFSPALAEIRVIVKPGGTLSGTVEKGEGATVVLVPQSLAAGDIGRLRSCGAGGSFEFAGLPAGDYYLIAVNKFDLRSMSGTERLREMMRNASAVRVEEGASSSSVQLKLQ